jgi:tetratricopeptide (TPR) repeat protein
MSDFNTEELSRAEELILENKMDEALELVKEVERRALIYYSKSNYQQSLFLALKCNELYKKILYKKIGNKLSIAGNLIVLGYSYVFTGDYNTGLICGQTSLTLYEELENQEGRADSLHIIGLAYNYKGKFDQAIKFSEKSLSIEEINHRTRVGALYNLGNVYYWKGEIDQSLKYCESALELAKDMIDMEQALALILLQIGNIYQVKGDFDKAKEYFGRGLEISEEKGLIFPLGLILECLILLIRNSDGPLEEAQKYSDRLRELAEQSPKNRTLSHQYQVGRACILLTYSSRTQDRAEAELLLKQIVRDKISNPPTYIYAIFFLCEFLIEELKMSNDIKVLDELNPLVNRLLNLTEKTHSYIWQVETKILQSKLALIQMEFSNAKLFLSQAQQIAESYDLKAFVQKISDSHDHLLEQQDMWEHLNKIKAPMAERINLASFDGIIAQMQGRQRLEPGELVNEQSILLLIIAEGGVLVFSYPFSEEWKFDDELFGGFLTAFNSISDEIFSEGLDRVKFGKQTVLMEKVVKFSICYLFKGQTYPAKQKFDEFIMRIQDNSSIIQTLEKYHKTSQIAELTDIPSIEPLIQEIFSNKRYVKDI